jgi:hypothetical protein
LNVEPWIAGRANPPERLEQRIPIHGHNQEYVAWQSFANDAFIAFSPAPFSTFTVAEGKKEVHVHLAALAEGGLEFLKRQK